LKYILKCITSTTIDPLGNIKHKLIELPSGGIRSSFFMMNN